MSEMIEVELELNRAWIYNEDGEPVGETNFVVSTAWAISLFKKYYRNDYATFEDFLEEYEPETEGEFIYKKAKEEGVLKEDFGIMMY